jgi:NSS family neurotransmitter:Na+ symporter
MLIITIRGITLPGALAGVNKYLEPNFSALLDMKIWIAAYGQIFFTLSVGFGIMIAYSSYLPDDADLVNNAFIIALSNCLFSFIVGIGVFGILGYMAAETGQPISKVVTQSIGLAFVAFPKSINLLPGLQTLFAVLFFASLAIAGFSSSVSILEAVISGVRDKFDLARKKAVMFVCGLGFLVSLLFTTGAGLYFLDIVDHWMMNFGIAFVGLVEAIIIGWVYKASKIRDYVNPKSDYEIGGWWNIMIKFVTPLFLGIAFFQNLVKEFAAPYGGYATKYLIMYGWLVAAIAIVGGIYLSTRPWRGKKADQLAPVEEEGM